MLKITIPGTELYDEKNNEFIQTKDQVLCLEHSLVSISKWESKWCIPFLDNSKPKTVEQTMDYVRCMTLTQNVDENVYKGLTNKHIKEINDYIDAPMTATWFSNNENRGRRGTGEKVTSELIYYWMIALNIPFECQKWHLNRLLTLIRVCNIKNQPPKKMSNKEIYARNNALNQARRKALRSKG